ncbi:Oidioi.mRNA.OKI2018_I69.XSR.g14464.t4.cds [Oikopleura dioica]|nr:Oidioi.mRNA.OKI2018_I69.XSR.g14464.t4.cds [Oikopleura dioica]
MQEAKPKAELNDENATFPGIDAGQIKDYLSREDENQPLVINCLPQNPPASTFVKQETFCKKASKADESSKKETTKKASKSKKSKKCKKQPSRKEFVKEEDPDFAPPYLPPNYIEFFNNYMYSKALEDSEFWEVKKKRPQTQPTVFKYPNTAPASNIQRPTYQSSIPSTSSSCYSAAQNRRPVQQPSTSQDGVHIFRCPPLPMRLHSQTSVSHQLHHQPPRQHSVAMRPSQQASTSLQIHYEDPSEQQQTTQIEEMETYELQPIENHANISSNDQETHLLTMMEVKTDEHQNSNQQSYMSQQTVSSPMAQHQQSVNTITFPEQPFQCQLQASQQIHLPELQRREHQQHLNFSQPLLQQQNHHHQLMQLAPIQSHQQQINPQTNQTVNKDDPGYWPENITWDELV